MELVLNSLEYYDKYAEEFEKISSKVKYYKIVPSTGDTEKHRIITYDKDKKELFNSRFEYIGMYYNKEKLWVWSWADPSNTKNLTYMSKNVWLYAFDLDAKPENYFLKTEFTTGRFSISDPLQIDFHIAIFLYLTKMKRSFRITFSPDIPLVNDTNTLLSVDDAKHAKIDGTYKDIYFVLLDDISV